MSTPAISVVVPVFNAERFLGELLDSVFAQSLAPTQVIVVDDGSTDGSTSVAKRYGERLELIRQGNEGPSAARNRGIEAASHELIALCDADDICHPDRFRWQADFLENRLELAGCFGLAQNFWVPELDHEARRLAGQPVTKPGPKIGTCTLFARREAFERSGLFREDLRNAEDVEWVQRAEETGLEFGIVERLLLFHRVHSHNLSRLSAAEVSDDVLEVVRANLSRRRQSEP